MELSRSKTKKFLIFSYISGNKNKKKNSLYFRKIETQKDPYISGNETFLLQKNLIKYFKNF